MPQDPSDNRPASDRTTAPAPVGPSGARPPQDERWRTQTGERLTSAQGVPIPETDHSLKAGSRGPTLVEDFHFREKITHFDHERIPERVVHARGAGARGTFRSNGAATDVCAAAFLAADEQTPVYVRFSTVLGSRGSADTVRDVRGFATKFYTREGNFDLVGNNMPVFFIQDAIKFPDLIHAGKPHPDREIPQAQTAHDTFWDFVSLHTEATHMMLWAMSDRAVPRSYRMMEGFGVHTFRLVAPDGSTTLAKFHWKPRLGVHSLVWEEAQVAAGTDPDFHRRDLADAIDNGALPEWHLGLQLFPDTPEQSFEGIDLLDPTKIVPEELAPVQVVGTLTLESNPTNYFAETEQVAFHTHHLVRGVEPTDDPLLQGRGFSYLDTQLSRLGGPNFAQLPVNRPQTDVDDMLRDGMHQSAVHEGITPYKPNSLGGNVPRLVPPAEGGYQSTPRRLDGVVERVHGTVPGVSFDDHYTQATLFWRSMTPVEQGHIVEAFTFELGKCAEPAVRERMVGNLARVDATLCRLVADGLGLPVPEPDQPTADDVEPSPALRQITGETFPLDGRVVGLLVGPDVDADLLERVTRAVEAEGAVLRVVAPDGGPVGDGRLPDRTLLTVRSIELDGLLVADGAATDDVKARLLVDETYRHVKALGAWGDGTALLRAAGVPDDAAGVGEGDDADEVLAGLLDGLRTHRAWDRFPQVAVG